MKMLKGYGFLSFAKNIGKNIGKNISKNLSDKYGPAMLDMRQKLLDQARKSATDAFKTSSKGVIQKISEATGDLIGNKIANKITGVSNEHDKEIPNEYASPDERQGIIDELRLK